VRRRGTAHASVPGVRAGSATRGENEELAEAKTIEGGNDAVRDGPLTP
jgi:hypothetical protein